MHKEEPPLSHGPIGMAGTTVKLAVAVNGVFTWHDSNNERRGGRLAVGEFGQWNDEVAAFNDTIKMGTTTAHEKEVRVARNEYG